MKEIDEELKKERNILLYVYCLRCNNFLNIKKIVLHYLA